MTETELQFDNITPQNLKDNETIYKLLKLYNSSFEDFVDILENPLNLSDTDFLIKKYEETANVRFDSVRREIFKIHLQEIFQTFEEIGDSEEIYNKFKGVYESLNISTDNLKIVADIDKSIDSQYLNASKSFKTKKGTRSGFFFVYDIINKAGIQAINTDKFFNLIEGTKENPRTPYEYTVETSLYKEVFQKTIVPLAHPVGFNWNFIRLLFFTMEDYFGLEEIKTLGETLLTCYGSNEAAINQQEIVNSKIYGTVKNFLISENQDKQEQIIIDYNPLDGSEGDGLRLLKDFNGTVVLYDRQSVKILRDINTGELTGEIQYLEIDDIRLIQEQNGILTINKVQRTLLDETFEVIESIDFKEYTIIDKEYIEVQFKVRGDFEDKWNNAKLYLMDKVVSDDIKFFETKTFTRQDILDSSSSYNGRIVKDMGSNCLLTYKAIYTYKVSTKDVSEYVESVRPHSLGLETDVTNISIPQSEYDIAISEGRDPYKDLYATHDHTIQEFNLYDTNENFARLAIGNIPKQYSPYRSSPDISIDDPGYFIDKNIEIDEDTDWRINWGELHLRDLGFNPNNPSGPRWESFYTPEAEESLNLIGSTTPVQTFIRQNLEWAGNKGSSTLPEGFGTGYIPDNQTKEDNLISGIKTLSEDYLGVIRLQGNGEYIAWENFDVFISYDIVSNVNLNLSEEVFNALYNYEYNDYVHEFLDDNSTVIYLNDIKEWSNSWETGALVFDSNKEIGDGDWAIGFMLHREYESEHYKESWITENDLGILDDSEYEKMHADIILGDKKYNYNYWSPGGIEILESDSEYEIDGGNWAIEYILLHSCEYENYRISWTDVNEEGLLDYSKYEEFEFGVYRDGVLLEDNNLSAIE